MFSELYNVAFPEMKIEIKIKVLGLFKDLQSHQKENKNYMKNI